MPPTHPGLLRSTRAGASCLPGALPLEGGERCWAHPPSPASTQSRARPGDQRRQPRPAPSPRLRSLSPRARVEELEPPWTLPRDLEEEGAAARGEGGRLVGGESPGIRLQPLGKRLGGRIPLPEPLSPSQGALFTQSQTPTLGTPSGQLPHRQAPGPTTSPSPGTRPPAYTPTGINSPSQCAYFHASLGLGLGALGHTGKVLPQEEAEDHEDLGCLKSPQRCQVQ